LDLRLRGYEFNQRDLHSTSTYYLTGSNSGRLRTSKPYTNIKVNFQLKFKIRKCVRAYQDGRPHNYHVGSGPLFQLVEKNIELWGTQSMNKWLQRVESRFLYFFVLCSNGF